MLALRPQETPGRQGSIVWSPARTKSTNVAQWLSGCALGIRARGPGFDSRVALLFHWVATLGKLFTHIASAVSQLQETGVQKRSFRRLSGYGD